MDEKDTSRLEAFSDGVFAVAITLLILNVTFKSTNPDGSPLSDTEIWSKGIVSQWSQLFAFVTSFFTIGVMWLNHHRLFKLIRSTDTVLLILNLLLLMIIVFIPVPTSLLAQYLKFPQDHGAALIYCGAFLLMTIFYNFLWRYAAYKGRLLGHNVNQLAVAGISRQYLAGPLVYLVAFGLARINTLICVIFCFVLAIFFAIPGHELKTILLRRRPSPSEMSAGVSDKWHEQ